MATRQYVLPSGIFVAETDSRSEILGSPPVYLTETSSAAAVSGILAATEAPDVAAIVGTAGGATGTLVATEAPDVAAFTGTVATTVSGILAATEAPDVAAFTGIVELLPVGVLAVTEAPDNALILADYRPPKALIVPYPSKKDYGWFKGDPPLKKKWR